MGQPLNRKRYVSRRKEISGRYSFLTSHSKTICPLWKKQNKNQVNSTKEVHNLCVPIHRNRTYLNSEWDPLLQKHLPINVNDIIIRLLLLLSIHLSWRMKVYHFFFIEDKDSKLSFQMSHSATDILWCYWEQTDGCITFQCEFQRRKQTHRLHHGLCTPSGAAERTVRHAGVHAVSAAEIKQRNQSQLWSNIQSSYEALVPRNLFRDIQNVQQGI